VGRKHCLWVELQDSLERRHVRGDIAAMARRNHDRRTFPREVTAEQLPTVLMPEAKMIGRVTRRVHRGERRVASGHHLSVSERVPAHTPRDILFRPRHLEKSDMRHALRDRHCSRCVIDVTVCDQHLRQPRTAEGTFERLEMRGFARTRIDQRRHLTSNEPGGVAPACHRAGIERVHRDGLHDPAPIRLRPTRSERAT